MGVIFVGGIYGVGKSTICKELSKNLKIKHFDASNLIANSVNEIYGKNKFVISKENNQTVLISAINKILEDNSSDFILSGHFTIINKDFDVEEIPLSTFSQLQINKIILLYASPKALKNNLENRDNKIYEERFIEKLLIAERNQAYMVKNLLYKPFIEYEMQFNNYDLENILKKLKEE